MLHPRKSATPYAQRLRQTERTPEAVFAVLDDATQHASDQVAQSPERAAQACASGCTFCCHLPVDITALEALRLAAYLRHTLSPEAGAALRQRLAATVATITSLSYEAHAQARIPCALLRDGTCMAYAKRPFACRAWNSTSRDRCEAIFSHGDPVAMLPPLDMPAYDAVWEIALGIADGLKHARLDSQTYELHSVLLRALEIPDAAERWLHHDDVFAGCLVGAFPHMS